MHLLTGILDWIALLAATAAVAFSAGAIFLRWRLSSLFLLTGAALIWLPVIFRHFSPSTMPCAGVWVTRVGIASMVAYLFFKPWRTVPDDHRRLFAVSLTIFMVILTTLGVQGLIVSRAASPGKDIARWLSFTLDMAPAFRAALMILFATIACTRLHSNTKKMQKKQLPQRAL